MSLKLHLKPNEKIIIGGAVVKNGNRPIEFTVENNVPILRQKDIMNESGATSPARRAYFILQLMYIDVSTGDSRYSAAFKDLEQDITTAVPSTRRFFEDINGAIAAGKLYHALKTAQLLIDYEGQLLSSVNDLAAGKA